MAEIPSFTHVFPEPTYYMEKSQKGVRNKILVITSVTRKYADGNNVNADTAVCTTLAHQEHLLCQDKNLNAP